MLQEESGRGLSERGRGLRDVRSRGKECRSVRRGWFFNPTQLSTQPHQPETRESGPRPLRPQTQGSRPPAPPPSDPGVQAGRWGCGPEQNRFSPYSQETWRRERQDTHSTFSVSAVKMRSQGYRGRGDS